MKSNSESKGFSSGHKPGWRDFGGADEESERKGPCRASLISSKVNLQTAEPGREFLQTTNHGLAHVLHFIVLNCY